MIRRRSVTILIYLVRTQYLQSPNPFAPDWERLGLVVLHISASTAPLLFNSVFGSYLTVKP